MPEDGLPPMRRSCFLGIMKRMSDLRDILIENWDQLHDAVFENVWNQIGRASCRERV